MKSKVELRNEILQRRDTLTQVERKEKSYQIAQRVVKQKEFIDANKILLFAAYKSEVDTTEIFKVAQKQKKAVYYPKVIGNELEFYRVQKQENLMQGYRGIREPKVNPQLQFQLKQRDRILIIMPGVVFDEVGNRIGYGGGYYDRFLQKIESSRVEEQNQEIDCICKMSIAFSCQMVETGQIPSEVHDKKVEYLITEEKTYHNANCSK